MANRLCWWCGRELTRSADDRLVAVIDGSDSCPIAPMGAHAYRVAGSLVDPLPWEPIETAPQDRYIWCYTAAYETLPAFESPCKWHPDAGFTTDELRMVTHWKPGAVLRMVDRLQQEVDEYEKDGQ